MHLADFNSLLWNDYIPDIKNQLAVEKKSFHFDWVKIIYVEFLAGKIAPLNCYGYYTQQLYTFFNNRFQREALGDNLFIDFAAFFLITDHHDHPPIGSNPSVLLKNSILELLANNPSREAILELIIEQSSSILECDLEFIRLVIYPQRNLFFQLSEWLLSLSAEQREHPIIFPFTLHDRAIVNQALFAKINGLDQAACNVLSSWQQSVFDSSTISLLSLPHLSKLSNLYLTLVQKIIHLVIYEDRFIFTMALRLTHDFIGHEIFAEYLLKGVGQRSPLSWLAINDHQHVTLKQLVANHPFLINKYELTSALECSAKWFAVRNTTYLLEIAKEKNIPLNQAHLKNALYQSSTQYSLGTAREFQATLKLFQEHGFICNAKDDLEKQILWGVTNNQIRYLIQLFASAEVQSTIKEQELDCREAFIYALRSENIEVLTLLINNLGIPTETIIALCRRSISRHAINELCHSLLRQPKIQEAFIAKGFPYVSNDVLGASMVRFLIEHEKTDGLMEFFSKHPYKLKNILEAAALLLDHQTVLYLLPFTRHHLNLPLIPSCVTESFIKFVASDRNIDTSLFLQTYLGAGLNLTSKLESNSSPLRLMFKHDHLVLARYAFESLIIAMPSHSQELENISIEYPEKANLFLFTLGTESRHQAPFLYLALCLASYDYINKIIYPIELSNKDKAILLGKAAHSDALQGYLLARILISSKDELMPVLSTINTYTERSFLAKWLVERQIINRNDLPSSLRPDEHCLSCFSRAFGFSLRRRNSASASRIVPTTI